MKSDPQLALLEKLSVRIGGSAGRMIHQLHLGFFRPGPGGVVFQELPSEGDNVPPWPKEGEPDTGLEEEFGPDADDIRILTPEELQQLRNSKPEDDTSGLGSKPEDPDFSQPGGSGKAPADGRMRMRLYRMGDGTVVRASAGGSNLDCGMIWLFDVLYSDPVPQCAGLNWAAAYRASLLRAFDEAHRLCRENNSKCPDARLWLLHRSWDCVQDDTGACHKQIDLTFAVMCNAR